MLQEYWNTLLFLSVHSQRSYPISERHRLPTVIRQLSEWIAKYACSLTRVVPRDTTSRP